jgi:hypothetical protein
LPRVHSAEETQHTRSCAPSTPQPRAPRFQPARAFDTASSEDSTAGGIDLKTCERQNWFTALQRPSTVQPASPSGLANIRVRRSNHGSMLLQSPARAGHTTRMRQIFEHAGLEHHEPPMSGLYPQLPNISRRTSPPPVQSIEATRPSACRSPSYRPESLCLSTKLLPAMSQRGVPHASQANHSEGSAGSWSDDSGYLINGLRGLRSESFVAPGERIYNWLSEVDEDHNMSHDTNDPLQELHEVFGVSRTNRELSRSAPPRRSHQREYQCITPHESPPSADDPFFCNIDISTVTSFRRGSAATSPTRTYLTPRYISENAIAPDADTVEEGGIPLSPNVCIERGPSRYHSPRKLGNGNNPTSPGRPLPPPPFPAGHLKENVVLGGTDASNVASPLTIRSTLLGNRFRRGH